MRLNLLRQLHSTAANTLRINRSLTHCQLVTEAVVALESTVICHGLPYPQNLETAASLEQIISENGAKPATIAVMKGKVKIGLEKNELLELAQANPKDCLKVSRRDLAYVVSRGQSSSSAQYGGTTVSGTMVLAHQAGISVFATGGIGGVHRDGHNSLDVSADLTELGRTPVAVVCAGVKSILDIPRTLEYLETQGVCVATVGETPEFPSFFSRNSGCFSSCHVESVQAAAELIYSQKQLRLQTGILLAVPIPKENEIPSQQVETWLAVALREADLQGISGRDITPFLLKRLTELSAGKTLKANVALLRNNAKIAAQIAVALKKLERQQAVDRDREDTDVAPDSSPVKPASSGRVSAKSSDSSDDAQTQKPGRPVVIGGTVLDIMAQCTQADFEMNGATYIGETFMSAGGVGRNIADCLARLNLNPILISAIGRDAGGQIVKNACSHMDLSHVLELDDFATSSYVGLLAEDGQLKTGIMEMNINGQITPDYISHYKEDIAKAPMVVLDGNLSLETIDCILTLAGELKTPVWFDPTDIHKAHKPFQTNKWTNLNYLSPNLKELMAICEYLEIDTGLSEEPQPSDEQRMPPAYKGLFERMPNLKLLLLKLGKRGSLIVTRLTDQLRDRESSISGSSDLSVYGYHAPPVLDKHVVNVSGSGDCMVGGMIYGLIHHESFIKGAELGTITAGCSLKSRQTVPATITAEVLGEFDTAG